MTVDTGPSVPFLELRPSYVELQREIDAAVGSVLASGWYLLGEPLKDFEETFARYTGAPHCRGVANGLDALVLALRAAGIGPGDEVIVPSNTYIATWLAVSQVGAVLVPVEPDPRTYNIDVSRIADAITARTRAIMPVHLYGQPADMAPIVTMAAQHSAVVIADAAQAHGARYRGQPVGAFGDAAGWSFFPTKNLGAIGDGGAVTTCHDQWASDIAMRRNYGSRVKYVNDVRGINSRLDDLQAAVLSVKLSVLDEWNSRRLRQAARYSSELAESGLVLPFVPQWAQPAWHLYVVQVPDALGGRERLQERLKQAKIMTMIHYPIPPHRQDAYADAGYATDAFPIASHLARTLLSLPLGPHLSDDQQTRVIEGIRRALID
ncbi:MAG: DegT/DnrJ/EryC1/StrS family aminotransferase [Gemmatimonadaceae bacterium]|nr:DegT/DnrJ/EryC1/StrS family aminotransferase [Gemmatimonadaceae bacterium]